MQDVLFARGQMAMSLAFHIVFAAVGMAMPLLMVMAEIAWRRTGDDEYLTLTRAWAKGAAVLFAVGAVSGTVLSFELGLLFPTFMRHAGAVIGMPFSLEGFAFFTEAIFLGVYLYGWDRVSPRLHVMAGAIVAASGLLSAIFVTIANAWMNAPRGFRWADGKLVDIDPLAAMRNPFALHEVLHMALAAYLATAAAVAGIHAYRLLKRRDATLHKKALTLALWMAIPSALLQPFVGHYAGQQVARLQPAKLAAMEHLVATQAHAPLHIGPLRVPSLLSVLAFNRPSAVVTGLDAFPRADWPHPSVRWAFQAMVALGSLLALHALWAGALRFRRRPWPSDHRFLVATVCVAPFGMLALEAGWAVTELGRQPWVIYGVLRTVDAATPMHGLCVPFVTFSVVYLGLAATVLAVLRHQVRES